MARKVVLALKALQELGNVLRRRRRELGVNLEEVQEHTKIRIRYLEALEAGDWDVLPGDVYARGFVRRYAEYVQLDGIDLLHTYIDHPQVAAGPMGFADEKTAPKDTQTQSVVGNGELVDREELDRLQGRDSAGVHDDEESRVPVTYPSGDWRARSARTDVPKRRENIARHRSPRSGFGGQAAVVIGILIVLGGGWWALSKHAGTVTKQPSSGGVTRTGSNTPGQTQNGTGGQTSNTLIGGGPANNTITGNQTNSTGNSTNATTPGAGTTGNSVTVTAQPFQSSNPPTQSYDVQTTGPMSVTLSISSSACWVSVTADGNVVDNSETLQPGQSKTWTGSQTVDIYLGHPQSASITVNGQAVTLPPQNNPYHAVFRRTGG